MKKLFKKYAVSWAILFVLYNVIVFAARPVLPGFVVRYDARFWTAYCFSSVALVAQLVCADIAFREENSQKFFYKLPLITISYTTVILMVILSSVCMLIPNFPAWPTVIICAALLAVQAVAVINASAAGDIVSAKDEEIKAKTFFIKSLTADIAGLMDRAKTEEVRAEVKKVYDAVRYSDPMSSEALSDIEAQISNKFNALSVAVAGGETAAVKSAAEDMMLLVSDRNRKCKMLK